MKMEIPTISNSQYTNTGVVIPGVLNAWNAAPQTVFATNQELPKMPTRRLVRVIIVDPNDSLPLDKAVLHDSGEQFTDLTDQELFFGISLAPILDAHNEYRKTMRDKSIKERVEYLEPARVRDLKMNVVNIAQF